jgi:hypothetical protein
MLSLSTITRIFFTLLTMLSLWTITLIISHVISLLACWMVFENIIVISQIYLSLILFWSTHLTLPWDLKKNPTGPYGLQRDMKAQAKNDTLTWSKISINRRIPHAFRWEPVKLNHWISKKLNIWEIKLQSIVSFGEDIDVKQCMLIEEY